MPAAFAQPSSTTTSSIAGRGDLLKLASTNRDIAVSQDGVLAWVTRKDAPALTSWLKSFFSTHKLTF